MPDPAKSDQLNRGAYLVEGPAHCGECHTPRNLIGGPDSSRAYGGGPAPEGGGKIPNITSDATGLADWSEADIANLLETGLKPNFEFGRQLHGGGGAQYGKALRRRPRGDSRLRRQPAAG